MYRLILSDATEFQLVDHIEQVKVQVQGTYVNGIRFTVTNTTVAEVQSAFKDPEKTDVIKQVQEDGSLMSTQTGYTKLKSIAMDEESYADGVIQLTVVMRMPDDLSDTVKSLGEKIVELANTLADVTAPFDPNTLGLEEAKEYQIKQSEINLETYLLEHPITSSVHGEREAKYSCTMVKQQLLTQAIALAQMAVQTNNTNYKISWNATGEQCTYDWTLEELVQLSFEFEAFVRPFVSEQQNIETQILACQTTEEVFAVNIDFNVIAEKIEAMKAAQEQEKNDTELVLDAVDTPVEETIEEVTDINPEITEGEVTENVEDMVE